MPEAIFRRSTAESCLKLTAAARSSIAAAPSATNTSHLVDDIAYRRIVSSHSQVPKALPSIL